MAAAFALAALLSQCPLPFPNPPLLALKVLFHCRKHSRYTNRGVRVFLITKWGDGHGLSSEKRKLAGGTDTGLKKGLTRVYQ